MAVNFLRTTFNQTASCRPAVCIMSASRWRCFPNKFSPSKMIPSLISSVSTLPTATDQSYFSSLKSRGLYNYHLTKHVSNCGVDDMRVTDGGRKVYVKWEDGHQSNFHAIWLRHNCHCPKCRLDHNGMIKIDFRQVDKNVKVTKVELESDKVAVFTWHGDVGERCHVGAIPVTWLRQYCYSHSADSARRRQRAMKFYEDKTIPEVQYQGEYLELYRHSL